MTSFVRPLDRLQILIDTWWEAYLGNAGGSYCPLPVTRQLLDPDITDFDADSFIRGLGRGLFVVELARPTPPPGPTPRVGVFERIGTGRCQMRQESIVQFAAATELILDYEWPPGQVAIESPRTGTLTRGALDVLVFGDAGLASVKIAVEAKARRRQLTRFLEGLRTCRGASTSASHRPTDHKKCLGIMAFRPELFLAVAGGVRQLFRVTYRDGWFSLGEGELDPAALEVPR